MPDPQDIQSTLKDPKFLALSPDDQVSVLKHLHEGAATTPTPAAKPDSIVGGFGRRAVSAAKGVAETFDPRTTGTAEGVASAIGGPGGLALERTAKSAYENVKQRVGQAAQDVAGGHYGKAALHAFEADPSSPIGPLSPTQSLVDTAEEGRYREALGGAAFDALTTLLGKRLGAEPSERAAANKLTVATGETGETYRNYRKALPDIKETIAQGGKPKTVGDLKAVVQDTLSGKEAEFQRDMAPIANQSMPLNQNMELTRRLSQTVTPNLAKTPEGQAQIRATRDVLHRYDQPWTVEEMNLERSRLRKELGSYYDKSPSKQASMIKSDAEARSLKIVADYLAERVNDAVGQASGKGASYYKELRQKQEALVDLNDHLDSEIGKLEDKQARHEGLGPLGRITTHAYVSPGSGIRAHVSGLKEAVTEGELSSANRATRSAFGSKHPVAGPAVASLPLGVLNQPDEGKSKRRSSVPPPPTP